MHLAEVPLVLIWQLTEAKWTKKLIQIVLRPLLTGVKEFGLHPSRWMDDTAIGEGIWDSRVTSAAGNVLG
jgi:hypothetical protein